MKSLKMFVLALSVVLAACESDGAITGIPSSSTSTHHVSILELIPIDSPTFNTSIYFGKNPIDSTANTFGQYQTRYGFVPPIRLEDGETANLIASLEGAGGMQHARVRQGAFDVVARETSIELHRGGEVLDEIGDGLVEAARPELHVTARLGTFCHV